MSTAEGTTHDAQDRFNLGDPAEPEYSLARHSAELRSMLLNCICPHAMKAAILSMVQRAMDGDVAAAKVVLEFAVGKPQQAPEPDRMDAYEWALYQETEPMKTESAEVLAASLPGDHIEVARVMGPVVSTVTMPKYADMARPLPSTSTNGEIRQPSPSANGVFRHPPSANGGFRHPPSANGVFRYPPSANGVFRHPPSANGVFRHPPSANGVIRHPPQANGGFRHPPSANGGFRHPPSANGVIRHPPSANGVIGARLSRSGASRVRHRQQTVIA